ncbi:MAG TPA: hypothetical protein VJ768_10025, partial [Anaerolineales bacterium]|nr:hypothetical protein [Anaerolineales bacterium]
MRLRIGLALASLAYAFLSLACVYIVLPEGLESPEAAGGESAGWSAVATNVGPAENGGLRIDLTIRNETGDWSAMEAIDGEPAALASGGETVDCETVFVGTGGHRLAPGFQMRAFTAGTKAEQVVQPIYVECPGAQASEGAILSLPYTYVTGQYNYYEPDNNR